MYYKLIKNFVKDNLYDKETLTIYADRNDALDWENLEDIFLNDGVFNIAADGLITLMDKKVFFTESNTKENPLIQIADIFAGMGRSSYEDYDQYEFWSPGQQTLIPFEDNLSNKQQYRFQLYKMVDEWAKETFIKLKNNAIKALEIKAKNKYLEILYSNPAGFTLTARMTTNYRCLRNIYIQRHNHRLPEWRAFCKWIETLPYAEEFLIN